MDTFADREIALLRSFLKSGDGNDLLVLADLYQEHNKAWEETLCRVLNGMPALRQATHELATVARQDLGTLSPDADDLAANTQYAWAEQEARKRVANGLWEFRWLYTGRSTVGHPEEDLGWWSCTLNELMPVTNGDDEVIGMSDRRVARLDDIELAEGDRHSHMDGQTYNDSAGHCRYVECELAFNALHREAWFEFPEWTVRPPDPKPLEVQPALFRRYKYDSHGRGGMVVAVFPEFPAVAEQFLDDAPINDAYCLMIDGVGIVRWSSRMQYLLLAPEDPNDGEYTACVGRILDAAASLGLAIEWVKRARPGADLRRAKRRKKYIDDMIPF